MSDPNMQFEQLLALIGRTDSHIIIGRQMPGQDFAANRIKRSTTAEVVAGLREVGSNLWFEINPSSYAGDTGRSSAKHITRLMALYADIDYKPKPQGMNSEPEAYDLLADLEAAIGVQATAVVHSGHGIQPYWPIEDGQITDQNRDSVALLLKRWGALVQELAGTQGGHIDNVYDLSRILRVPGSSNVKQSDKPVDVTMDVREGQPLLTLEDINSVLDDWNIAVSATVETSLEPVSSHDDWDWADNNCHFYDTMMREISESKPAARHPWALKEAALIYGMVRYDCLTEEGYNNLAKALLDRFRFLTDGDRGFNQHEFDMIMAAGLQKAESWSKMKHGEEMRNHVHQSLFEAFDEPRRESIAPVVSIFSREALAYADPPRTSVAPDTAPQAVVLGNTVLKPDASANRLLNANLTDTGNGERIAQAFRGKFIYVPEIGWMHFEDGRYVADSTKLAMEDAKDVFVQMAALAPSEDARKWGHSSLSRARLAAALELASSVPAVGTKIQDLDSKPLELNTPGGIVDLATGNVRQPDALTDRHTKRTTVTPANGTPVRFLEFLDWAMRGDVEKQDYLQQVFGLAIIGELRDHLFPIFLGPTGANGKSTLLNMIVHLMGDYAIVLQQRFLVEKRNEDHPTAIAQLRGVRLAVAREVPPNSAFDEELVKTLSGEETLRARLMGEDFFQFTNSTLVILLANHRPRVTVGGPSFWRRTRQVDFLNSMPVELQDPKLADHIVEQEGPQILNWMIEGAERVIRDGLRTPNTVLASTKDYETREDQLGKFLNEVYTPSPDAVIDSMQTFRRFADWQASRGIRSTWTFDRFHSAMIEGHPEYRGGDESTYAGLALSLNGLRQPPSWARGGFGSDAFSEL